MRKVSSEELKDIISKHKKWLLDDGGERANLSYANLSNADLSNANLRYANLNNANLNDADLRSANLRSANLDTKYISITRIGSTKRMTTYSFSEDKIWCGCFTGTLKEFKDKVLKDYPDKGNTHHIEYTEFIKYLKKLRKAYKEG